MIKCKDLLFVTVVMYCVNLSASEKWHPQNISGQVSDFYFHTADTGWAVGFDDQRMVNLVAFTDNGGETWTYQSVYGIDGLTSVFFLDSKRGFVSQSNGYGIYTTETGGQEWKLHKEGCFDKIAFVDQNTGFAVSGGCLNLGSSSFVYRTTDAGTTWNSISNVNLRDIHDFLVVNAETLWVVGVGSDGDKVHSSFDGGITWQTTGIEFANQNYSGVGIRGIAFSYPKKGWIVGNDAMGQMIHQKTIDGGKTWRVDSSTVGLIEQLKQKEVNYLGGVEFLDSIGFIFCENGYYLRTKDDGATWGFDSLPDREKLRDVTMHGESLYSGRFKKTEDGIWLLAGGSLFRYSAMTTKTTHVYSLRKEAEFIKPVVRFSKDVLNVSWGSFEHVELYNFKGELVWKGDARNQTYTSFTMSHLSYGMYMGIFRSAWGRHSAVLRYF